MITHCATCNTEFRHKPSSHRRYCSPQCYAIGRSAAGNKETCTICGKTYAVRPSRPSSFCSRACQVESWKTPRVEKVCEHCGDTFEVNQYRADSARFCSFSCRAYAVSVGKTIGVKDPNRVSNPRHYERPYYLKLATKARKRDNYTCQDCGRQFEVGEYGLDVHHIVPIRCGGKDKLNNLVCLCRSCHVKVETALRRAERETAS
jgi:hypothetical protein